MDEYKKAAEEMKEAIINEYLKKHPEVNRHEIITRLVNGRIVIDTITNVFNNMAGRKAASKAIAPEGVKRLRELAHGGDERYAVCLESISQSIKYINWLHAAKFTTFGDKEKNDNLNNLNKKEELCGIKTLEVNQAKEKLTQLMASKTKMNSSSARTLVMEYFHTSLGQLKCQCSIFQRECTLGDTFGSNAHHFIMNSKSAPDTIALKTSSLRSLEDLYKVLIGSKINIKHVTSKEQLQKLERGMDDFQVELQNRRQELEKLKTMVEVLEAVLDSMEQQVKETKSKSSGPRMAFTSKKRGR